MSRPELSGVHHVKIPVTALGRALPWYERVFGFRVTWEFPDEDGTVRGVAGQIPGLGDILLALRENGRAAEGCRGFDPVGFGV
ncbi:VOC family protein [Actinomadura sp. 9N407]|uniref:VOC family protein n=1 Tax=Actinomadura sp. 9N407 TaxID=3375154 RepID=UPI0037967143